jgi:hypothetical protein
MTLSPEIDPFRHEWYSSHNLWIKTLDEKTFVAMMPQASFVCKGGVVAVAMTTLSRWIPRRVNKSYPNHFHHDDQYHEDRYSHAGSNRVEYQTIFAM